MHLIDELLNVVLPASCVVCGHSGVLAEWRALCEPCVEALPVRVEPVGGPPSVTQTFALGPHDGPLGVLIREAKYGKNLGVIDSLGRHLGEALTEAMDVDAIVPIPIPTTRRWMRGFDQGERLGLGVAKATGIPLRPILSRRSGSPQVGKGAAERRKLPICAISVAAGSVPDRILLVDDVRTTGATLHAAARALRRRGVVRLWAVTVSHQDV